MSYLRYAKKDVNEVRFVKCPSKCHNENKIIDISTIPRCRSVLLYYNIARGRVMLFVSVKEAWQQILNFQVYHGWDENANMSCIEEPLPQVQKES